jgi:glycosyltransferase involved in cell wall biosynthesis
MTDSMDLISVIVPVYKVEPYLRQCVDSILAQTYTNLEVILVDDGSPDNCGMICDEYAAKDPRVKVIHKENGGVSCARNGGIDVASGEFICFVDSDDVISPYFVEYLKRAQESCDADISYCGHRRFYEESLPLPHTEEGPFEHQELLVLSGPEALANQFAIWYTPNVWDKLIRRSLFENLRFPKAKRAEDLWMSYHLLAKAPKIAGIKKCELYYYRCTEVGAMAHITPEYIEDDFRMRLSVFTELICGKHPVTQRKLAAQTRRMFLDFALSNYADKTKEVSKALQKHAKVLYAKMWKPTAESLWEKTDYIILATNVRIWTILQLVRYKLFKVPLYVE